jgi:5-methylcytosine-specific restriction endonuclease McrA
MQISCRTCGGDVPWTRAYKLGRPPVECVFCMAQSNPKHLRRLIDGWASRDPEPRQQGPVYKPPTRRKGKDKEKQRSAQRRWRERNRDHIAVRRRERGDHKKRAQRARERKLDPAYREYINDLKRRYRQRKGAVPRAVRRQRSLEKQRERAAARAQRAASPKTLLRLLRKFLQKRCGEEQVNFDAVTYAARYRNDPAFRDREVERAWIKKQAVRPRLAAKAPPGETALRAKDIQRLFAAAQACPYCQKLMGPREKTLDHLVPISRGGAHTRENVAVACHQCNTVKHARTPLEFVFEMRVGRSKVLPQSPTWGTHDRTIALYTPSPYSLSRAPAA